MDTASDAARQPGPSEATPHDQVQALLEAARYDDIEDVASSSSTSVSFNSRDSQGRTVLHMAAANGQLDIVEYLINNGVTSVDEAVSRGKMEVVDAINAAVAQAELNCVGVS